MRYLSVCSGIEAASEAWRDLGWQCAGVSEIEKFPRAVLEHRLGAVPVGDDHRHTPGANMTPLFGDFTKIRSEHVGPIDLLVGGTPCQSFSVAGKRLGLDDPRGNLTLEFLALARRVQPRWIVWENVPGVLSHDEGRTMGTFLRFLGECGYRWAYRVLDAQYVRVGRFGRAVPQRRRRVFLVGYSGTADINPAAVLFDRESLHGNPAPRREAGQGVAVDVAPSLVSSGRGVERTGETRGQNPVIAARMVAFGEYEDDGTASAMKARDYKDATDLVAHALRGEGFDASEDGTGRGTPIVPVQAFTFNTTQLTSPQNGQDLGPHKPCHALSAKDHPPAIAIQERAVSENPDAGPGGKSGEGYPAVMQPFTITERGRNGEQSLESRSDGTSNAILTPNGGRGGMGVGAIASQTWGVRRLTPRECERLMGFPEVQENAMFFVCSDPQKANALAAQKCPKSPSNVWHVEGGKWKLSAEAAAQHSSTSHPAREPLVAVDVLIDLEQMAVEISSVEKSLSSASVAEKKSEFHALIQDDDFARLTALTAQCLARATLGGKAAIQSRKKHSTHRASGSSIVIASGREIADAVADVESAISKARRFITSTISHSGQDTLLCASTLKTLCCSVAHAIDGFTPEKTKRASSYAVRITVTRGFTKIPWRGKDAENCPDGPRYKALGNSMAVNCMAWIGERIEQVEQIAKRKAA